MGWGRRVHPVYQKPSFRHDKFEKSIAYLKWVYPILDVQVWSLGAVK